MADGLRERMQQTLPAMLLHEGTWEGVYRTVSMDGSIIDSHRSRVVCEFPDDGPFAYVQRNHFAWDNGDTRDIEFGGSLQGDRIVWDTDRFQGYGWQTDDNVVLLNLLRKDEPGVTFLESIVLAESLAQRFRTWHWFREGQLYQRTLCDEHRSD